MKIRTQKMNKLLHYLRYFLFFLIFVFFLKMFFPSHRLFLNITPSVRIGLYWMQPYDFKDLEKGMYVIFPPPKNTPKNRVFYEDFLKEVVATSEDSIFITEDSLFINGIYRGKIKEKDSLGNSIRSLPTGKYSLEKERYFMLGTHKNSYDSRYFGGIEKKEIKYVGKLLIPFSR